MRGLFEEINAALIFYVALSARVFHFRFRMDNDRHEVLPLVLLSEAIQLNGY